MSTKHPPPCRFPPPPDSSAVSWRFAPSVAARELRRLLRAAGFVALGAGFFSLGVACTKPSASEDDDRARLSAVLAADAKVDALLGEADRLDRLGRSADAAKVVETEATPALTEAKSLLEHTIADTAWGKERREELKKLLDDRAAAMPSYTVALRGSDPTAKLEAVVAQTALEKRALGVASAMKKKAAP